MHQVFVMELLRKELWKTVFIKPFERRRER
jgi:hypothetical protein